MVKYLFLDIEWNAKDGSQNIADWEPIQVAAIGTDDKFNIKKVLQASGFGRYKYIDGKNLSAHACEKGRGEFGKASL